MITAEMFLAELKRVSELQQEMQGKGSLYSIGAYVLRNVVARANAAWIAGEPARIERAYNELRRYV